MAESSVDPGSPTNHPLASTAALIARVREGDGKAREQLLDRYHGILMRWAHGRLPPGARSLAETGDLVQLTLIRVLDRLDVFEPRHEGAFLAYLRHTLMNVLRNEYRRSNHDRRERVTPDVVADSRPSILEEMIGKDVMESYEAALATLPQAMQEAIILRLEFDFTHGEIADSIGSPSANAARMLVSRGLVKLSKAMVRHR
jgi:RNA polymerase sigma-70 factor (ECF subfamily)